MPRVSTSAQNGATIGTLTDDSGCGVKLLNGPLNVRLPLLLIQTAVLLVPKKLIGNPMEIALEVEPSSFAGIATVVVHPEDRSTTFGPSETAARRAPG